MKLIKSYQAKALRDLVGIIGAILGFFFGVRFIGSVYNLSTLQTVFAGIGCLVGLCFIICTFFDLCGHYKKQEKKERGL